MESTVRSMGMARLLANALALGVMMLLVGSTPTAWAASPMPPASVEGARVVTAEELKALRTKGAKIYDLRKKAAYVEAHIPGAAYLKFDEKSIKAVNFDPRADTFDLAQLPPDKTALIVFHSHGPEGWKSYKAAVMAVRAGYTNVHWFRGGFAEWVQKGLPRE